MLGSAFDRCLCLWEHCSTVHVFSSSFLWHFSSSVQWRDRILTLLAGHSYFEETASTSEADVLPQLARFISASAHTQPFLLLSSSPPHFICSVAQIALPGKESWKCECVADWGYDQCDTLASWKCECVADWGYDQCAACAHAPWKEFDLCLPPSSYLPVVIRYGPEIERRVLVLPGLFDQIDHALDHSGWDPADSEVDWWLRAFDPKQFKYPTTGSRITPQSR
jgi:hypothetical protein